MFCHEWPLSRTRSCILLSRKAKSFSPHPIVAYSSYSNKKKTLFDKKSRRGMDSFPSACILYLLKIFSFLFIFYISLRQEPYAMHFKINTSALCYVYGSLILYLIHCLVSFYAILFYFFCCKIPFVFLYPAAVTNIVVVVDNACRQSLIEKSKIHITTVFILKCGEDWWKRTKNKLSWKCNER